MTLPSYVVDVVRKQLAECAEDAPLSGVSAVVRDDTEALERLQGSILGPEGSPYEGGVFLVDIVIPPTYPFRPPTFRFETMVWHPNISSEDGSLCMFSEEVWSPALKLNTALITIRGLLSSPDPTEPHDVDAASMCLNHPELFDKIARSWTENYAKAS
ncbi:hypothetical protein Poli38472_013591 [Pythium oligandrum]|uniref:UBC core domain-containing protein n=1 Tax=Pythium oligandrum TaxID=41045 RepID=A0A8K1CDR0_PYTOL|nr:hypothetical protein Poli38472_013591 [Pythium oligandrum]|eukprot:TMW61128.1 hypothetical protein Poli38472_013591 [Pythium oligandrum]